MSYLKKLSVQGIRSFGPHEDHTQTVDFFSPVTLIVGPNGTGKTSVIECLRYGTTGELPPGCKQSGAFVHDPKVADDTEVRGQVRLSFTDVCSKPFRVQRSLIATMKPHHRGISMRTLEGVVVREGPDGQAYQITSRCTEIDREVISALGVSKPILENVIFCHQEESNWPLSEGKILKSKFDDIFAATKYIKALENLRKIRMEKTQDLKIHRAELPHLLRAKEKAETLKKTIAENEKSEKECRDLITTIEASLCPIEAKLETITREAQRVYESKKLLDALENQSSSLKSHICEIVATIPFAIPDDIGEIQHRIMLLEDVKTRNLLRLSNLDDMQSTGSQRRLLCARLLNDLIAREAAVSTEMAACSRSERKTHDAVRRFESIFGDLETKDVVAGGTCMSSELSSLKNQLESTLASTNAKYNDEISEWTKKLDELKNQNSGHEHSIRTDKVKEAKLKQEIQQLKLTSHESIKRMNTLSRIDQELKEVEKELTLLEQKMESGQGAKQLEAMEAEHQRVQIAVKEQQTILDSVMIHAQETMKIEYTKNEIVSKEQQLKRCRYRIEDMISKHFPESDAASLKAVLDAKVSEMQTVLSDLEKTIQSHNYNLNTKEERKKMHSQMIEEHRISVEEMEAKLSSVSEDLDLFAETTKQCEDQLNVKRSEIGLLRGMEGTYEKFLKRMSTDAKPGCPLCCRSFENQKDSHDLMNEIKDTIASCPKKCGDMEREISKLEQKLHELHLMQPMINKLSGTRKLLCDLEDKNQIINADIKSIRKALTTEQGKRSDADSGYKALVAIQPEVATVDRLTLDIKNLQTMLPDSSIGGDEGSKRSVDEIKRERDDLQTQAETVASKLQKLRAETSKDLASLCSLKQTRASLLSERLAISEVAVDKNRVEENIKAITVEIKDLEAQIQNSMQVQRECQHRLDEMKTEMTDIKSQKQADLDRQDEKLRELHQLIGVVQEGESATGRRSMLDSELQKAVVDKKRVTVECLEHDESLKSIQVELDNCRSELADHEGKVRTFNDAIKVCEKKKELKTVQDRLAEHQKSLEGINLSDLGSTERSLRAEQDSLLKQKHVASGRLMGIAGQLQTYCDELNEDIHINADVTYRKKMITIRVVDITCGDIDKYYQALDRSVMAYHSMKMIEVNKIIRDLWRSTYRGNDIDFIEIRSEAEDVSGAAKARRSYNYKVVMVRSGIALDMRSRCSAGQKVLASLIIRLALAEAFGTHCGVIALDEPTTNLDRENIESLASALIEIIETRRTQKNFQLVVITHDEDFVEMLSRSNFVETFYRIQKDERGLSLIVKCDVIELR